jgi:RND superfamily putative drug exporter
MVLVPATMAMLGRWNWWLPGWLDRLLPTIEAETSDDLWDELDSLPETSTTSATPAGV